MNFGFDVDQRSLGETIGRRLAGFPALTAPALADAGHQDVWRALTELGLFALLVPERRGGVGLSLVDLALGVEALGDGLAPLSAVTTLAATDVLARHGSDTQQHALLPAIASGEMRVGVALHEAGRSYDPQMSQTSLTDQMLRGSKILVADAAHADLLLVVARMGERPALVAVDTKAAGVAIRRHSDLDPSAGLCEVIFDRVRVGDDAILGHAAPERATARLLEVASTLYAGLSMGIAARMLATSVEYARTRVQFGQPIGAFQAIKHRCADMAVAVEAGRSAAYYAFWAMAEAAPDAARAASMAKAYCGDVARNVLNEAIQIHGGMGFTWELGLHRFLRRSKVIEHSFGDAAWHNERILADTLAAMRTPTTERRNAA